MFDDITGFALSKYDTSFEAIQIELYCKVKDIKCIRLDKDEPLPDGYIPSGSVEWCQSFIPYEVIPDYYPEYMSEHLHRKVWKSDKWELGKKVFVKPSDKYKRFTGKVVCGTYKGKKKPPFWYSDVVTFTNEWRYYVAAGKILSANWYYGDEVNTPEAPILPFTIHNNCYGAVDFGTLPDGRIALVEYNHPFACGWYGKDISIYMTWLKEGWIYMMRGCK